MDHLEGVTAETVRTRWWWTLWCAETWRRLTNICKT